MTFSCATFILIPELLADAYTNEAGVIALTAILLPLAGLFQVVDGLQVVAAGCLRGAADTRMPLVIVVAAYWFVGLPVSWFAAYHQGLGPTGLWWGLVAALAAAALLMLLRLALRFRDTLERTDVNSAPAPTPE